MFWLSEKNASKARLREAENARKNRAEIEAAHSQGQVSRRDLIKMGILTTGGLLAVKNGLSPFAKSAYADSATSVTGLPSSPGPAGSTPFTTAMFRTHHLQRHKLGVVGTGLNAKLEWPTGALTDPSAGSMPVGADEQFSTRLANTTPIRHRCHLALGNSNTNVVTARNWPAPELLGPGLDGPREGRPPGEFFAHQRWQELINSTVARWGDHGAVGAVVSHGELFTGFNYSLSNPGKWATQNTRAIWTNGEGRFVRGGNWVLDDLGAGRPPQFPALFQGRYGEMMILRNYNNLPFNPADNGGYGRNEPTTHNHNAHNGGESDGAGNAHFFPGQYYDYVWSGMLARHDLSTGDMTDSIGRSLRNLIKFPMGDPRASSPTDTGGIELVPGDFREQDGSMWFHDHRISFTSENVYKGYAALLEYFSGPDRGYERPGLTTAADAVNLRLPSGWRNSRTWGNRDFDIYFLVQDVASMSLSNGGQQFFDVFDTDGFLGDVIHVNFQWKPFLNVLPRKYRFRILSAGMSRWIKLAIADVQLDSNGHAVNTPTPVPVTQIANDGNLFPRFVRGLTELDVQGTAERYDIIVDFSTFPVNKKLYLVNLLAHPNPLRGQTGLTLADALSATPSIPDPGVGAIMEFRVVSSVPSLDSPGDTNTIANSCGANDMSLVNDPGADWEIPTVEPVRHREIRLVPDDTEDSGLPFDHPGNANLTPEAILQGLSLNNGRFHNEHWAVRTNGGAPHHADMRRASNLPRPGDVEHWNLVSGTEWHHPLHLHFEEAKTLNRNGKRDPVSIHPTELDKRKDVWHVGDVCCGRGSSPEIQVTFGEFGGAYVNHCHNTVHEDNAMLIRYDLIRGRLGTDDQVGKIESIHATVLPTPDPRTTGVTYVESCNLSEGNPQGFDTGVNACPPNELGPVAGPQGPPPDGYVDLTGFVIP